MSEKLKIIDSHFHVWDLSKQNLPWLATTDGSITKTFSFEDLKDAYAKVPDVEFVGGVYVEVDGDDPLQEDRIVFELKESDPQILACMLRSRVEPYMRLPLFAHGVREPLHIDSEPRGRCLEPAFIQGLKMLAQSHLPFESCNRVEELEDAYSAFSQVPDERVILNHLGNVTPESFDDAYRSVMERFSKLPELYLKVSGFPTSDKKFVQELLGFIKETFSPERLLWASNWPVVSLYSSFEEHLACVRDAFGDDERLFYTNAKRAYKLA